MNGSECKFMSVPGDCSSETLLVFLDNGKARSPILIKDRDLYPQYLANTPTLSNAKSRIARCCQTGVTVPRTEVRRSRGLER